jgi:biopolymer transport protein ExbB
MLTFFRQIFDYISPGGIIMIPLVIISIVMWILILDKILLFRDFGRREKKRFDDCPEGFRTNLLIGFYSNYLKEKTGRRDFDRAILIRNIMKLKPLLYKNLPLISILATVAPLLGLLGTVTGMINTFEVIKIFGNGNASAMAVGIKEALITTQGGLFISIPGLFMSVYLYRQAEKLENTLNRSQLILKRTIG